MSAQAALNDEGWRLKYYDQLAELEKKEQEWAELGAVLKRAIGRLSLAAKGQNDAIDRRIGDIRKATRNQVDVYRLETALDDLTRVLTQTNTGQVITTVLKNLINKLALPENCDKQKRKLLKRLSIENDDAIDSLVKDTIDLLDNALSEKTASQYTNPGLLDRLLYPSSKKSKQESGNIDITSVELQAHRDSLLLLLDKLSERSSMVEELSALRNKANDATERSELELLSSELASLLKDRDVTQHNSTLQFKPGEDTHPNMQELLIHLLDQLAVPTNFDDEVKTIKARLNAGTEQSHWKPLLNDVATLINSVRGHMHKEKQEFEEFLRQISLRLKELDTFLANENASISTAEKQGEEFDKTMGSYADRLRDDMNQAVDLEQLKITVEGNLDHVSQQIRNYRETEKNRYRTVKKDVASMQQKVCSLETQTIVLKNEVAKKSQQAMFDVLTSLPNRLAYEIRSDEEVSRWKRFKHPLTMVVWDIDHFKKVNDKYGHKAGDKALIAVARVLKNSIRETDFVARFGGEEFVMLLPNTDSEGALILAEQLRQKIIDCGFHYKGESADITISCGISSFGENDLLPNVFERADRALYKAKHNGRNQCTLASD